MVSVVVLLYTVLAIIPEAANIIAATDLAIVRCINSPPAKLPCSWSQHPRRIRDRSGACARELNRGGDSGSVPDRPEFKIGTARRGRGTGGPARRKHRNSCGDVVQRQSH